MKISTLKAKNLLVTVLFSLRILNADSQNFCITPNYPGFTECESIDCAICNLNGYLGSTAGYGDDPDGDLGPHFCSTVESVQYIQFYAAVSSMSITVITFNCNVNSGVDLAIYEHCDQHPLFACQPGNGTNITTINLNSLIVGEVYTLVIDVDAMSSCDFSVSVNPANGTVPPFDFPTVLTIEGDFNICAGSSHVYSVSPVVSGFTYI